MKPGLGEACSILSALAWAVGIMLYRQLGASLSPLRLNFLKNLLVLAMMLPAIVLVHGLSLPHFTSLQLFAAIGSGVLGIGVADTLYFRALNELGAGRMEYDVLAVGAGPAGLAFAIRLKQLKPELSVCVIEKSSTIGAHILSGAVIEPGPLDELLPGWRDNPPPICVPAKEDEFWVLSKAGGWKFPIVPPQMNNHGNFIVSLGAMRAKLCR